MLDSYLLLPKYPDEPREAPAESRSVREGRRGRGGGGIFCGPAIHFTEGFPYLSIFGKLNGSVVFEINSQQSSL